MPTAPNSAPISWLFSTRPELREPDTVIDVPLLLPRGIKLVQYDVRPMETLLTPFGEVPVFRLTPRRVASSNGDLLVEMWIAPQYGMVRASATVVYGESGDTKVYQADIT